jgi:membrane associated rhomboid family serine protease/Zn-finger nucleic acid-binding protein
VLRDGVAKEVLDGIWARARAGGGAGGPPCPSCMHAMAHVGFRRGGSEVAVDACERCRIVWFDPGERAVLAPATLAGGEVAAAPASAFRNVPDHWRPPAPPPAPPPAHVPAPGSRPRRGTLPPDPVETSELEPGEPDWWKAALGLPVTIGAPAAKRAPWLSRVLAFAIAGLALGMFAKGVLDGGLSGMGDVFHAYALAWGFVPADPGRHAGLTHVTAFFLHAGLLHALWNAYFLRLAATDVEGILGPLRLALLLAVATVTGNLFEMAFGGRPEIPRVGASGGISGVFAYYALALPRVRVGIGLGLWGLRIADGWRLFQLRFTVPWLFGIWLVVEVFSSLFSGATGVAHLAHVGGALAGLAYRGVEVSLFRGRTQVRGDSDR